MRVTRPNLLSWHDNVVNLNALPSFFPDCRTTPLVTFAGEVTSFYLNLITSIPADAGVPLVQLVENRTSGTATNTVSAVVSDVASAGHAYLYGSITCPLVPAGLYRWKLTWGPNVWTSSLIEVLTETDARAESIRLEFTHHKTIQGVRYPWIPNGFICQLRIRALLVGVPDYPAQTSAYREVTTGITINYNTASDKVLKFQLPMSDVDLIEGVEFVLLHDSILLNGRSVTTRDHIASTPGRSKLAAATFSVIDNSYANPLIP